MSRERHVVYQGPGKILHVADTKKEAHAIGMGLRRLGNADVFVMGEHDFEKHIKPGGLAAWVEAQHPRDERGRFSGA